MSLKARDLISFAISSTARNRPGICMTVVFYTRHTFSNFNLLHRRDVFLSPTFWQGSNLYIRTKIVFLLKILFHVRRCVFSITIFCFIDFSCLITPLFSLPKKSASNSLHCLDRSGEVVPRIVFLIQRFCGASKLQLSCSATTEVLQGLLSCDSFFLRSG